ncbi:regulatory signaling modulator protein AmpE [Shigella flexneri]
MYWCRKVRLHYHAYWTAASRNDSHARATMAGELTDHVTRPGRLRRTLRFA